MQNQEGRSNQPVGASVDLSNQRDNYSNSFKHKTIGVLALLTPVLLFFHVHITKFIDLQKQQLELDQRALDIEQRTLENAQRALENETKTQEKDFAVIDKILSQKNYERIITLEFVAASTSDDSIREWAKDLVKKLEQVNVRAQEINKNLAQKSSELQLFEVSSDEINEINDKLNTLLFQYELEAASAGLSAESNNFLGISEGLKPPVDNFTAIIRNDPNLMMSQVIDIVYEHKAYGGNVYQQKCILSGANDFCRLSSPFGVPDIIRFNSAGNLRVSEGFKYIGDPKNIDSLIPIIVSYHCDKSEHFTECTLISEN